jgi:hypothetical protein
MQVCFGSITACTISKTACDVTLSSDSQKITGSRLTDQHYLITNSLLFTQWVLLCNSLLPVLSNGNILCFKKNKY